MTKNMGLVHSAGCLASPCFISYLQKKKVSCTCLILGGMLSGNKLLWNVARKLKNLGMSSFSAYTLFSFLSLLCMNSVTWDKMQCPVGSVFFGGRGIVLHGHQTVSNELLWFPNQMSTGQYYLSPLLHVKSLLQGKLCPREFVTQEIVIE